MPGPTAMLRLPSPKCPHPGRLLGQGREGQEQGPQAPGRFAGSYEVKPEDLTTITTSTGPAYSSEPVRANGWRLQTVYTQPHGVNHHDRTRDGLYPSGHGMGAAPMLLGTAPEGAPEGS